MSFDLVSIVAAEHIVVEIDEDTFPLVENMQVIIETDVVPAVFTQGTVDSTYSVEYWLGQNYKVYVIAPEDTPEEKLSKAIAYAGLKLSVFEYDGNVYAGFISNEEGSGEVFSCGVMNQFEVNHRRNGQFCSEDEVDSAFRVSQAIYTVPLDNIKPHG